MSEWMCVVVKVRCVWCVRLLKVDSAPRTALTRDALRHLSASISLLVDSLSITAALLQIWQLSQRL